MATNFKDFLYRWVGAITLRALVARYICRHHFAQKSVLLLSQLLSVH